MKQKNNLLCNFPLILLLSLLFILALYLNYHQIYTETLYSLSESKGSMHYNSDTLEHISYLKLFFKGEHFIPHPLWHIGVKGVSLITSLSIEDSAILFSSFIITLWVFLVYLTITILLKPYYSNKILLYILLTVIVITIGPLSLPFYNKFIFLGQGSPNIWHNSTLWMVKPFGLLTIIYSMKAIQYKQLKLYIYAIFFMILSLFAKPSFALIFIPSFFLLFILQKDFQKKNLYFILFLFIITGSILLYQMHYTFNTDSSIIFDFLGVWSLSSNNIIISILLALAFPLLFILLYRNSLQDNYLLLAWIQTFLGIILFMCFAESGSHYSHGNFGWSYMISLSYLYLFSIIQFVRVFFLLQQWKKIILSVLLMIQTYIGLFYFFKILEGYNPLYIGFYL